MHEPLIYIAQEKQEPIHGWPAIQRYLEALPGHLDEMSAMELNDVRIDPLGEVATAFFNFRAQGRLKGRPTPHQPTGRVTMIFLHTPPGWRAIHYHESALAARA